MTEIFERAGVARILADPRFLVPEADAGAATSFERFRARVSRFANGMVHDQRRARLEVILATLDPRALAGDAAARTRRMLDEGGGSPPEVGADVDAVARHVPVATLAHALEFRDPDEAPALVARIADRYASGRRAESSDTGAEDSAIERLLTASGAAGHDADLLVQLLVQAFAATGTLVTGALRRLAASADSDTTTHELLRTTLRDDSPVPLTRRIAPDGALIILRLDGPDRGADPAHVPRTLAFGDGQRACPAPHHALAIAAAIVDVLRGAQSSRPTSRPLPTVPRPEEPPMSTAADFRAMHRPGAPFVLPNAWDLASARWLRAAGHPVVGTTSLGVAFAAGRADGAGETAAQTFDLAARITAAGIPVTVDIEAGFSDDPDEVGEYACRLANLGVVGLNIEDSDASGNLVDVDRAAHKIAAIAAAAPGLYLNARTDPFWIEGTTDAASRRRDAVDRAHRYLAAGASGVFVPGAIPLEVVATLTRDIPAPVNVLVQPGTTVRELAAAGVARISTGSLLFRAALGAIEAAARAIRDDVYVPDSMVPDYGRVVSMP